MVDRGLYRWLGMGGSGAERHHRLEASFGTCQLDLGFPGNGGIPEKPLGFIKYLRHQFP